MKCVWVIDLPWNYTVRKLHFLVRDNAMKCLDGLRKDNPNAGTSNGDGITLAMYPLYDEPMEQEVTDE